MNYFLQRNVLEYLWRGAIVAGVLLLSIAIAFMPMLVLILLLVAMVGAIGVFVLFRQQNLSFIVLMFACLVVPVGLGTGSNSEINAGMLMIVLMIGFLILNFVIERKIWVIPSRPTLPLICLVVVAILSFGFGQFHWYHAPSAPMRAQLGGLGLYILSVAAYLVTSYQMTNIKALEWTTWTFLALASIYLFGFDFIGIFLPSVANRVMSIYTRGAVGAVFWLWLVCLAASQAVYNQNLPTKWRIVLGILTLAVIYARLIRSAGWSSGWIPALGGLGTILLVGTPWLFWVYGLGGIGAAIYKSSDIMEFVMRGNEYSLITRLEAWRIVLDIVKVNPIFGIGPANYYWYTPLYNIMGYYVQFNSHNNYVDLVAQTGILGLLCMIWFGIEYGLLSVSMISKTPPGFARAYTIGCVGGIVGTFIAMMLGDWVIPFVYNIGFSGFRASLVGWVFLGGLIVIQKLYVLNTNGMSKAKQ